jgi:hypothetical protein
MHFPKIVMANKKANTWVFIIFGIDRCILNDVAKKDVI